MTWHVRAFRMSRLNVILLLSAWAATPDDMPTTRENV
jgi:hypothetical protein